jgi:hypothetical protein
MEAMGIVVTAFYLFGLVGLVLFNESLYEPTQAPRLIKSKPSKQRARTAHYAVDSARARKKAA